MSDALNETVDYEKLAFQEESDCLDSVEARIDTLIQRFERKTASLNKGLSGLRVIDYDDADRKKIATGDLKRYEEKKAEIEAYKPEPYFCHFELVLDGESSREFCIGDNQHDLRDEDGDIVLGRWSPLRTVYINKGQTHFEIEVDGKKHTYDLRLRRMVRIEDAILIGVNTEFDSSDVSLEGQVVDPFLIAVLHDKRRDYKLSDIVKTIQQNQNDILERPIDESYIVQGCAGSGKTMILLHRLSYLAFNHPEVDFSKYIVLTPNESFNRHIDELCEELDVGTITRLTVESYYVRLARRLSRGDLQTASGTENQGRQEPKITIPAENVIPEFGLSTEYLSEIYSEAFAKRIEDAFSVAKEDVLQEIETGSVGKMFLEKEVSLPNGHGAPYEAYLDIVRACSKIRRESSLLRDGVIAARAARDEAAAKLDEVSSAYSSARELLEPVRIAVAERAIPFYEARRSELEELRREMSNAGSRERTAREKVGSEQRKAEEEDRVFADAEAELTAARNLASQEIDIADLKKDPAVEKKARSECEAEQAEVARLQSELNAIGLFGFGRRRTIREDLAKAEVTLQVKYEEALESCCAEHAKLIRAERAQVVEEAEVRLSEAAESVAKAKEAYAAASERFERAKSERGELAIAVERAKAEVAALRQPIESFENEKFPNLATTEGLDTIELLSPELADYIKRCRELTPVQVRYLHLGENRMLYYAEKLEETSEILEEAEEALRADINEGVLEEAEQLGLKLDASVFDAILRKELDALRSRYDVVVRRGESYRHDLYLKALECVLYYGPAHDDKASICIDEAQDLSIAEHRLIRLAVGPAAALNLYGDTHQLVFPYKGIQDWSDLPKDIADNRYDLNENYRNTQQITEYCNERLGMDVTAIGLRGSTVDRLSLKAAIDGLFALKGAEPGIRCAVVYKRGLTGVKERLEDLLGSDASYGYVDMSKVSVIPVEAAKGLEFDAVVVIDNGMTPNERYLSFTRALDHLMVTHVKGATVGSAEEISTVGGRVIGASELKEALLKPMDPKPEPILKSAESEDDPFFDLDFS